LRGCMHGAPTPRAAGTAGLYQGPSQRPRSSRPLERGALRHVRTTARTPHRRASDHLAGPTAGCCVPGPGRGQPAHGRPPSFQGPESLRARCGSRCLAHYPQTRGHHGGKSSRCHMRQRGRSAARAYRLIRGQNTQPHRPQTRTRSRRWLASAGRTDGAAHRCWPYGGVLRVRLRVRVPFSRRHPC